MLWRLFVPAGLLLILVILLATAGGVGTLVYQSDLILPGVQAAGLGLGGKTAAEAEVALNGQLGGKVLLDGGDATWAVPAGQLGLALDSGRMAQLAYQQSRAPERLDALLQGNWQITVDPIWLVDTASAEAYLWAIAQQFDLLPVNASAEWTAGQLVAHPAVPGRALDVTATAAALTQDPGRVVSEGHLPLVVRPVPAAITDVTPLLAQAEELLAHTLSIQGYNPITNQTVEWPAGSEVWAGWLLVEADATGLRWRVDPTQVTAHLATLSEALPAGQYLDLDASAPAVVSAIECASWHATLRIRYHEMQHTVRPGDTLASIGREYGLPYPWLQQANPGLEGLRVGQVVAIPSPDLMLPLPIVPHKRIVVSMSQQRMWAYESGQIKWEWLVSTGIQGSPTTPGVFQVQSHEQNAYAASWDLWMPYFMGIYRPVPTSEFMNGFHGLPSRGGSQLLWTNNLGRPVTYGCILLSTENAAVLYDWAEEGTVVEIRP
ncbi:MAG: L,D-transpeptidase family protein [Chloroflexi bacterium]|nr:L,D-transpeptidase family protein [Chloroflexota bacterium]